MQARASGVLLHPGSLPGTYGMGDFGPHARYFVDWLCKAGQQLWQILPFAPPGCGNSPYMSAATMAGDPLLVSPELLVADGLVTEDILAGWNGSAHNPNHIDYDATGQFRHRVLREAAARFFELRRDGQTEGTGEFDTWCRDNTHWAPDYALFMALKDRHGNLPWWQWPGGLKHRQPDALDHASSELADEVLFWQFVQWQFDRQWQLFREKTRGFTCHAGAETREPWVDERIRELTGVDGFLQKKLYGTLGYRLRKLLRPWHANSGHLHYIRI